MSDTATALDQAEEIHDVGERRTFWGDAWRILRRRWLFWVSLILIVTFVLMAIVPQLFTWFAPGPAIPAGSTAT